MKKHSLKMIAVLAVTSIFALQGSVLAAEKYGKPDKVTK